MAAAGITHTRPEAAAAVLACWPTAPSRTTRACRQQHSVTCAKDSCPRKFTVIDQETKWRSLPVCQRNTQHLWRLWMAAPRQAHGDACKGHRRRIRRSSAPICGQRFKRRCYCCLNGSRSAIHAHAMRVGRACRPACQHAAVRVCDGGTRAAPAAIHAQEESIRCAHAGVLCSRPSRKSEQCIGGDR